MSFVFQPWHLFTLTAVGAAQQDYQRAVAYLMAENRILKAKIGKNRIPLSDDDRRVLAVKGKQLGRRALEQIATICTPDTILRWHRELVAEKWDHSEKRKSPGRPKIEKEIEELVLRMAKENPSNSRWPKKRRDLWVEGNRCSQSGGLNRRSRVRGGRL